MKQNEIKAIADMFGFPIDAEPNVASRIALKGTPATYEDAARRAKIVQQKMKELEQSQRITQELLRREFTI